MLRANNIIKFNNLQYMSPERQAKVVLVYLSF